MIRGNFATPQQKRAETAVGRDSRKDNVTASSTGRGKEKGHRSHMVRTPHPTLEGVCLNEGDGATLTADHLIIPLLSLGITCDTRAKRETDKRMEGLPTHLERRGPLQYSEASPATVYTYTKPNVHTHDLSASTASCTYLLAYRCMVTRRRQASRQAGRQVTCLDLLCDGADALAQPVSDNFFPRVPGRPMVRIDQEQSPSYRE